MSMKDAAKCER
jgi:hypothetical protein